MIYFEFFFEFNHSFLRLDPGRQRESRVAKLIEEMAPTNSHIGTGDIISVQLVWGKLEKQRINTLLGLLIAYDTAKLHRALLPCRVLRCVNCGLVQTDTKGRFVIASSS